jgi:hypothetical protein
LERIDYWEWIEWIVWKLERIKTYLNVLEWSRILRVPGVLVIEPTQIFWGMLKVSSVVNSFYDFRAGVAYKFCHWGKNWECLTMPHLYVIIKNES